MSSACSFGDVCVREGWFTLDLTGSTSKAGLPSVSVVMGTYNGERYIAEQLASVVQQTLRADEIIVCDDGSTDGTLDIVERMRGSSTVPIRIVRNERRLGCYENFLNGASLARSPYIAFCDQDDRWYPEKLETALAAMVADGAVLSAHTVDLMNSDGLLVSRYSQGIQTTRVVEPLCGDPWVVCFGFTLVFRRDLLDIIPFRERGESNYAPGTSLSHDRWVCALAHSLGRVVLLDVALASYRQHDAQLAGVQVRRRTSVGRLALGALHAREKLAELQREQATLTRVCRYRSALFASAQPSLSFTRDRLDRAAAFWSRLGDRHSARVNVHQAVPLAARFRALSDSLREGNYSSKRFGGRSFAKDLGLCLLGSLMRIERTD